MLRVGKELLLIKSQAKQNLMVLLRAWCLFLFSLVDCIPVNKVLFYKAASHNKSLHLKTFWSICVYIYIFICSLKIEIVLWILSHSWSLLPESNSFQLFCLFCVGLRSVCVWVHTRICLHLDSLVFWLEPFSEKVTFWCVRWRFISCITLLTFPSILPI